MGFLTTTAKVWYPAVTDKMQLHTLFSTMASSIENGIGSRIAKQEQTASAVANLPSSQTFVNGTGQTVEYAITSLGYKDGIELSNGKFVISTPGLYFFTFSGVVVATTSTSTGSARFSMRKNGTTFSSGLALISGNGSTASGATSASGVMKCLAGDVIDVWVLFGGATAGTLTVNAGSAEYNMFSAALIKAL